MPAKPIQAEVNNSNLLVELYCPCPHIYYSAQTRSTSSGGELLTAQGLVAIEKTLMKMEGFVSINSADLFFREQFSLIDVIQ